MSCYAVTDSSSGSVSDIKEVSKSMNSNDSVFNPDILIPDGLISGVWTKEQIKSHFNQESVQSIINAWSRYKDDSIELFPELTLYEKIRKVGTTSTFWKHKDPKSFENLATSYSSKRAICEMCPYSCDSINHADPKTIYCKMDQKKYDWDFMKECFLLDAQYSAFEKIQMNFDKIIEDLNWYKKAIDAKIVILKEIKFNIEKIPGGKYPAFPGLRSNLEFYTSKKKLIMFVGNKPKFKTSDKDLIICQVMSVNEQANTVQTYVPNIKKVTDISTLEPSIILPQALKHLLEKPDYLEYYIETSRDFLGFDPDQFKKAILAEAASLLIRLA